jgi:hypothetical protein
MNDYICDFYNKLINLIHNIALFLYIKYLNKMSFIKSKCIYLYNTNPHCKEIVDKSIYLCKLLYARVKKKEIEPYVNNWVSISFLNKEYKFIEKYAYEFPMIEYDKLYVNQLKNELLEEIDETEETESTESTDEEEEESESEEEVVVVKKATKSKKKEIVI